MKTLAYFLIWLCTRIAWALLRWVDHRNPAEPLLSDAEVMTMVDLRVRLPKGIKTMAKAVVEA